MTHCAVPKTFETNEAISQFELTSKDVVDVKSFRNFVYYLRSCVEDKTSFSIIHDGSIRMSTFEGFIHNLFSGYFIKFIDKSTLGSNEKVLEKELAEA